MKKYEQRVADWWTDFAEAVIPGVSHLQYLEMRKAFYAGAFSMLMAAAEIGDDDLDEQVGAQHLQRLKEEIDAFYAAGGGVYEK